MKQHYGCPIKATLNVMSGKWKVLALWYLSFKPQRFAELRDLLPGVTEKVLTTQLRELERDGVISRIKIVHQLAVPAKVCTANISR